MVDVVQALYNFAADPSYAAAIEKLHQAGVGLVAMKVMARADGQSRAGAPKKAAPIISPRR